MDYNKRPLLRPPLGLTKSGLKWGSLNPSPSEEANWSGSALFVIKYVNLYQQSGSSNLIGWKLEIQQDKGLYWINSNKKETIWD